MPLKVKATTGGVIVSVYVRPSAKQDRIDAADGIEIYTREPPEGNRANIAVIKMLSKILLIPRNQMSIIRGTTSRAKEVYIVGISSERFKSQLQNIDGAEFKV